MIKIKKLNLTPYFAILPAFIMITLFIIIPFFEALRLSFTDWDGIFPGENYIGFQNYLKMISNKYFQKSVLTTVMYSLGVVILQNSLGLLLAILLDQTLLGKKIMRGVLFLPALLSSVVVGYIFTYILSDHFGIFRILFENFGIDKLAQISWLGDPKTALLSVTVITSWQFMGHTMLIYLGALQVVPNELYESASIDGAGRIKKFCHITFPMIAQALTINIILTTIGCLKMFDLIWVLTGGGPSMATQTIGIYIYRSAFQSNRAGYGNAVSIFMFIVIVIISFIQLKYLTAREVEA